MSTRPRTVLLGGVPGVLKTSTAIRLAATGGFHALTSTDDLREALRLSSPDPFLEGVSHTRYELLGEYTPERLFQGFRRQAELLCPAVRAVVSRAQARGCDCVVEDVHLLPSLYADLDALLVVLVERDFERLQRRLEAKFPDRPALAARFDEQKLTQLLELQMRIERDARQQGATVWETTDAEGNSRSLQSLSWWLR